MRAKTNKGDCDTERLGRGFVIGPVRHKPLPSACSMDTPPQSLKENPVFLGEPGNGQTGLDTETVSPVSDARGEVGALKTIMQTSVRQ